LRKRNSFCFYSISRNVVELGHWKYNKIKSAVRNQLTLFSQQQKKEFFIEKTIRKNRSNECIFNYLA